MIDNVKTFALTVLAINLFGVLSGKNDKIMGSRFNILNGDGAESKENQKGNDAFVIFTGAPQRLAPQLLTRSKFATLMVVKILSINLWLKIRKMPISCSKLRHKKAYNVQP